MPVGVDPYLARVSQFFPHFLDMLGQGEQTDPFGDLANTLEAQYGQANMLAARARQALTEATNRPAQTTSPGLDFGATLLGGISQALAPQLQGNALAQQGLQQKNQDFEKLREDRLKNLEMHFTELASKAREIKNHELAVKMEQKAEQARKQRDKNKEALSMATGMASDIGARESAERVAGINADSRMGAALARFGLRMGPNGPEPTGTGALPTPAFLNAVSRAKQDWTRVSTSPKKDADAIQNARNNYVSIAQQMSEADYANPSAYVARLFKEKVDRRTGGWHGIGAKTEHGAPLFDPATIAANVAAYREDLAPTTTESAAKLINILVRGGVPRDQAEQAVAMVQNSLNVK